MTAKQFSFYEILNAGNHSEKQLLRNSLLEPGIYVTQLKKLLTLYNSNQIILVNVFNINYIMLHNLCNNSYYALHPNLGPLGFLPEYKGFLPA